VLGGEGKASTQNGETSGIPPHLRSRPVLAVQAFGTAVLVALIGSEFFLNLPGVSESTAAMVGAVAAVAGRSAVMVHGKA